ncbi:MAG: hydantoinase B/oxoprolinase family protein [Anaerolineae bacterium]
MVSSARLQVDPIKFEVIRNALVEVTEEMGASLRRSAYSTNIKTRADFSCAFFDRHLRPIAQAFFQPNHLGSLALLVPNAIAEYGAANLAPGDMLIVNYPYNGGVHLNDITLIAPVFYGHMQEPVGYVASLAHHVDVGGGAPASVGSFREVYQEGVIIPPTKLVQNGRILQEAFGLILAQIRSKRETAGDLRAQVAANNTGLRRLTELLERYGPQELDSYIDRLVDYTEQRTRADMARLPQGTFAAEGTLDNDGFTNQPVRLAARVTIARDCMHFDFTGCDPQRRAPVNSTFSQTYSACAYVLKCLVDADVPINAGFYRLLHVNAPSGTVAHATHPAPVVGGWETHMRLTDLLFKALAQAVPERVPAGTKGMICHAGFGGTNPRTGDYYCFLETLGGGYGGRANSDGPDAVQTHGQNTENAPVEETELNYPVRILRYELVPDSEGPGRFRGGLGLRRDYYFPDHEATFTILADRDHEGPWGLFGGLNGARAHYILNPDRESVELSSKTTIQLKAGDVVSYRTCGGGGYGPPEERDPARVLSDVREGKVSAQRALSIYRVAIDTQGWTVDAQETARLREGAGS